MVTKKKPERTTPFTARELIVELSKCDPHARVCFEFSHDDGVDPPLMRWIDSIDPKAAYCGGVAVKLRSSSQKVQK